MSNTEADHHVDLWEQEQARWHRCPISNDRFRFDVVPLALLEPSSLNPREPRPPHVDELVASMEHHGQLVPGCAVELKEGRFELLGGNHRRLAMEIVLHGRDDADQVFQLKILHPETTTARRLQISSELNASVKPLNYGEKCRHMLRVRDATAAILAERRGHQPTEEELAIEIGATAGEDKMIFILAGAIHHIRSHGAIKEWVDDHQHPIKLVRQRHDRQIITVKNLAYFLWPFVRQETIGEPLPIAERDTETANALRLTDIIVEHALRPLWDQPAPQRHQAAVDFVRHHPFRALAACLAKNQAIFGGRRWPLWGDLPESKWDALGREIRKARTIEWGDPQIREERSLANLATTIGGRLYQAHLGEDEGG